MKSQLLQIVNKMREDVKNLRSSCTHPTTMIKISKDSSVVGRGSAFPRIDVTCTNCGTFKCIFPDWGENVKKIHKTLQKQGFKDERLDCHIDPSDIVQYIEK